MMSKNKRAQLGQALTWLYKFAILVVVVGGIVGVVLLHYSKQFDVRDAEAAVLAQKLVECVAPDGIVREFSNASIRECFVIDESEFYLNASLDESSVEIGNSFIATLCKALEQKVKVEKPPACHTERYLLLHEGKLSKLDLFIAIKKIEKNL